MCIRDRFDTVSEVKKYIAEYIEQYVNYNYIRKYRKMIGIGWILI